MGRTLLTAFLILAILPLSAVSWYAITRERYDIQHQVTAQLSCVAAMMETQVRQWIEGHVAGLTLLANLPATRESASVLTSNTTGPSTGSGQASATALGQISEDSGHSASIARDTLRAQLRAVLEQDQAFRRLDVLDNEGWVLASTDPRAEGSLVEQALALELEQVPIFQFITLDPTADVGLVVIQRITGQNDGDGGGLPLLLIGWLNLNSLAQTLQMVSELGETGEIYLVDADGMALPQGQVVTSPVIESALAGGDGGGVVTPPLLYKNYAATPVIGVYRWMPELGLALVAEQAQGEAFATTDNVAAAVIGATLVVALVTAIVAAVVTRQITRPVVQLTESALCIAEGDLEQHVSVTSRDEIGILAYVFNRMTAELKALYDDLEEKVTQRTALLQQANYQIQRRAIQLAATIEVSQAATSILEPDQLLQDVVRLVQDHFVYPYVGIYLLDEDGKGAMLRAATGGSDEVAAVKAQPVWVGDGSAVWQASLTGEPCVIVWESDCAGESFSSPCIRAEASLPLRLGNQIIGVLDVLSTDAGGFDADSVSVLQNVANQTTIALENARAYEKEKDAARRLREMDEFKSRFLAHMSHELREPLMNIIGFSRVVLKGLDGPVSDQQRQDLQIVYANSQHLLGLINDLLDISQIEAGLMELQLQELDLAEIINSVMATASALVRDREIELRREIVPGLPKVQADAARIRQVLLRLLTNAARSTARGHIAVRAWPDGESVLVSVSDTGRSIAPQDQERIFERFEQRGNGAAGIGLALSKEFVEMHGGGIWVESKVGEGSTFTFSLPLPLGD
ncbi:MAG: ATP-binding protein [Chloroflexota bacterium]|nr:ATP-binding protein [Chloroflexota bacterium]